MARLCDLLGSPLTIAAALWLRLARRIGLQRQPITAAIFRRMGIYPLRDHYYDPQFVYRSNPWAGERDLPAIDMNLGLQLSTLAQFRWGCELEAIPLEGKPGTSYYYHNPSFGPGDAEYLYSLMRLIKPRRLVEIGCGFSTLMAQLAIQANSKEGHACQHTCIEPYEAPWLESLPVRVVRKRVEETDGLFFQELAKDDFLFIDSSHVIRPGGDVLHEMLHILPQLSPGVYIHFHDIFTPNHYPPEWVRDRFLFWNEQYMLEAFLSYNRQFQVVGALNYLWHQHREAAAKALPVLAREPHREPGSFWIRKL